MKKILALILALAMVFSLAACGSSESDKDDSDSGKTVAADGEKDGDDDSGKNSDDTNATDNETGNRTWYDLYIAYTDGQNAGKDSLDAAIGNSGDLASLSYMEPMLMLLAGEIDMALTSSFFSGDKLHTKTALKILYGDDVQYDEVGDVATLSYVDTADNLTHTYVLKYDGKDTALLTATSADGNYVAVSICVEDDFVAKTYYSREDSISTQLISYTNGNVFYCWDNDAAAEPEALYKNAGLAKSADFGKSMDDYLWCDGGVLTSSVEVMQMPDFGDYY